MKFSRLIRSILRHSAQSIGYVVSGNHVFTRDDYKAIDAGAFRASVADRPWLHSDKAQRIAQLLLATY